MQVVDTNRSRASFQGDHETKDWSETESFLEYVRLSRCGMKMIQFPVAMAKGSHLFPYRTQKLSPSAPKVLGWTRPGRIGRRRIPFDEILTNLVFFCCTSGMGLGYSIFLH